MKRYFFLYIMLMVLLAGATAQDLPSVWRQIENNNLTINALKQQAQANQMEHRVGLAPENPSLEFAYLWGNPQSIGNRIDVSATQSFDFPSAYVYRGRIADLKSEQELVEVQKHCRETMIAVGELYGEIVYQNMRIADLRRCLAAVTKSTEALKRKLEAGEVSVLDYNKLKLSELNMRQDIEQAIVERDNLMREMERYNGGQAVVIADTLFQDIQLPADFEAWFQTVEGRNPEMVWLEREQDINRQQLKLDRSMWAPQFSAGYMREQVPGEVFQGVKVGVAVPLWQNVNSVKTTKMQSSALSLMAADERFRFRNELRAHYDKVAALQRQIREYEQLLAEVNTMVLLQMALDKGEISIIDYLMEYAIYHESHEKLFELQRDAFQSSVEIRLLNAVKSEQ